MRKPSGNSFDIAGHAAAAEPAGVIAGGVGGFGPGGLPLHTGVVGGVPPAGGWKPGGGDG